MVVLQLSETEYSEKNHLEWDIFFIFILFGKIWFDHEK